MPKLIWREPIETTIITSRRDDDTTASDAAAPIADGSAPKAGTPAQPRSRVRTLGDIAGRESGALVVLLVAIGGLTLVSNDFLTGNNLANLARQVSIFGILAIGQLFVILTGGIDLSVGSILALSGAITAQLLVGGFPIPLAMLIGIAVEPSWASSMVSW